MTLEQQAGAIRHLFDSPYGPAAMQAILELAGAFEASNDVSGEEALIDQGQRALALEIAHHAGLMPRVPGAPEEREAAGSEGPEHAEGANGEQ